MSLTTAIQGYFSSSYGKVKTTSLDTLIESAKRSKIEASGVSVDPLYRLDHLDTKGLIELYSALTTLATQPQFAHIMPYHLFNIEDLILRQVNQDVALGPFYQDLLQKKGLIPPHHPLSAKIQDILGKPSRVFSLEPETLGKAQILANCRIKLSQIKPLKEKRPNKVLKVCLENERNPIGGVSRVVSGLQLAHKKSELDRVYSIHPLYEKDKAAARDYAFQGVVTHQYEGQTVTSSIYKNTHSKEYLVQPDPAFQHIFNISLNGVYNTRQGYTETDRLLYLGSAAAAFAALYRGKSGDKQIDVIQSEHGTTGACVSLLLKDGYNAIRSKAGLPRPKTIQVFHNGNLGEKSLCLTKRLTSTGIRTLSSSWVTACLEESVRHSDKAVFVSSELASRALTPDLHTSKGLHEILKADQVVAIRNGIDTERFDPTQFKDLALTRTFDPNGIETTDYMAYRKGLKQALFKAGLLAHPDLPLILYVGRYAREKGRDILISAIKNTDPKKAQFVTMGVPVAWSSFYLSQLNTLQKHSHKDALRAYTQLEDQTQLFFDGTKTYNVSVGQLMRAAADAFIVPSHVEACGLVPMEGFCGGAVVIAPHHQGLKDICEPVSKTNTWQQTANAVCYEDHANSKQATLAVAQTLKDLSDMTSDERNTLARRLRKHAVENCSWYHKDGAVKTGVVVAYHDLYNKLCDKPSSQEILKSPEQAPVKPYPAQSDTLLRIMKWVSHFFTALSLLMLHAYHKSQYMLNKLRNSLKH
jgi:glycogen synthase